MKIIRPIIINGRYTNLERKIIEYAYTKIGKCPDNNKSRHVSVLVYGKEIVEYGVNNERGLISHRPFGYESLHSEYCVIRKFLNNHYAGELSQYDIFNIRINRYNEIVNSRPCKRCQYMMGIFPTRRVYFSDTEGIFQRWSN